MIGIKELIMSLGNFSFPADVTQFLEFLFGKLFKGIFGKITINIEDGKIVRWNFEQSFKPNNDIK